MVFAKPLSHQVDEKESRMHHAVMDSIKNFTPAWFAVNMGTGAVSTLLHSFPYGSKPVLHGFGVVFLIINILLFTLFCALSAVRYVRYPGIMHLMYRHPIQSLYLGESTQSDLLCRLFISIVGCFPMGFATLINASLNAYNAYGLSRGFLYVLWGLWWFDSILALGVYFLMLYTMITRHNHTLKALTAVWLLPAVTPIVPATTGALLARAILPHSTSHALISLFMAAVLLFLGLSLTFMILPLYMLRLITEGLPPSTLITSKFLPIGPCGQGGLAFVIIGQVFSEISQRGASQNLLLAAPQPWALLGVACGFCLWTFGIWWILLSILALWEKFKSDRPKFAVGFWGMVFPLGVYTLLTWQLSETLDSAFFRVLSAILSIVVFLLWVTLAGTTIYHVLWHREKLFSAPCLEKGMGPEKITTCADGPGRSLRDDNC